MTENRPDRVRESASTPFDPKKETVFNSQTGFMTALREN